MVDAHDWWYDWWYDWSSSGCDPNYSLCNCDISSQETESERCIQQAVLINTVYRYVMFLHYSANKNREPIYASIPTLRKERATFDDCLPTFKFNSADAENDDCSVPLPLNDITKSPAQEQDDEHYQQILLKESGNLIPCMYGTTCSIVILNVQFAVIGTADFLNSISCVQAVDNPYAYTPNTTDCSETEVKLCSAYGVPNNMVHTDDSSTNNHCPAYGVVPNNLLHNDDSSTDHCPVYDNMLQQLNIINSDTETNDIV